MKPTPVAQRQRRSWPIAAVFVAIVALQVIVAALSIEIIAAVRAYATGESLYSKGQKDAQIYLLAYAGGQHEDDYQRFLEALKIPLSDRAAREELQKPHPDKARVTASVLGGDIHPDDVAGIIGLFEWFHAMPVFATAIATWTEGDEVIEQMQSMVSAARAEISTGLRDGPEVAALKRQAPLLNARLTRLESRFSAELGEASRETQRLLLALNVCVGVLLSLGGAGFIRYNSRARALTEAAVREGEQRMVRLVDAVNDGVFTIDEDERVVVFNRAAQKLFQRSADDAIGGAVDVLIPQRLQQPGYTRFRDLGVQVADGGSASNVVHELTGLRANGQAFPLQASLSTIRTERGRLLTAVVRDVTELQQAGAERRAREALEASGRAKTEFLSRMSHELRTPLNAVLGFSQLLRLDRIHPASTPQLDRIRHIENAGIHLLALVNDVLDLSRVEAGQMTLSPEPVDATLLTHDAMSMVSAAADDSEITLVGPRAAAEGAFGEVWVMADRVRLRQVLVNLLSNAVKYNRLRGSVTIFCEQSDESCSFRVVDTGRGMSTEQLAHLFEPFNRLGAEHSKIEGTGIGLVLSRHLVELMNGRLSISSVKGQGTTATLTLARCAPPAVALRVASPPSQHGLLDAPLNVLYAEDNEVNVALVEQIVTFRPSILLRVAPTGASALQMIKRDPPDLLLLDMNLGDMTGLELVRHLRRHPAAERIRLVALSADALPEQIDAALAEGFEAYLTKPIEFRQLLDVLDRRM